MLFFISIKIYALYDKIALSCFSDWIYLLNFVIFWVYFVEFLHRLL